MSARALKCAVCGESARLRVSWYQPPVRMVVTHKSVDGQYRRQSSVPAQARYECLVCGVFMEHGVKELADQQLQAFGYPG